ncbi:MAG: competence/damage-inducible protein A [Salinivirgaceae bacterium]|nr:competence/damage-inducible protein A [Salinivirgaceae bacterium]
MMIAEIIAIGDEILIGQTLDTNSNWLASELTILGFSVQKISAISDTKNDIIKALENSESANLRIITGGLGPTSDDITKLVLSEYFNFTLEHNPQVFEDVCAVINSLNSTMNILNKEQALFPKGAKLLRNKQGTAPGMWFENQGRITISLPGVPFEMKYIFKNEAIPEIKKFFELAFNYYQSIMIAGYGESGLALKLKNWQKQLSENISIAYLPSPGIIKLRLGIKGSDLLKNKEKIRTEVNKLLDIIPEYIFSLEESLLEIEVGMLLKNKKKTLSTAESCTGGMIAHLLTSIPGSSEYYKGSTVAYSNEIKEKVLLVSKEDIEKHGAVSHEVVEKMAAGAKKIFNTDYSIATSGIAGPDGGTENKPIGTVWIAISGPKRTISKLFNFGNRRDINIQRSSMAALNLLRLEILND